MMDKMEGKALSMVGCCRLDGCGWNNLIGKGSRRYLKSSLLASASHVDYARPEMDHHNWN